MAVKDGLGPRPVAQSAKHYFLSLVYSCFCILASNFLFRASLACYVRWDCLSFLASFFGLLTLHLASLSVPPSLAPHLHCTTLVACNLFSDALPLLSAGVGGYIYSIYIYIYNGLADPQTNHVKVWKIWWVTVTGEERHQNLWSFIPNILAWLQRGD